MPHLADSLEEEEENDPPQQSEAWAQGGIPWPSWQCSLSDLMPTLVEGFEGGEVTPAIPQ